MRYFVYLANCIEYLTYRLLFGKLSIKALIWCTQFYTKYSVESESGEKYYSQSDLVQPAYHLFSEVLSYI